MQYNKISDISYYTTLLLDPKEEHERESIEASIFHHVGVSMSLNQDNKKNHAIQTN